jgi:membrane-associated protease RseP (regulator of RpoE activity)
VAPQPLRAVVEHEQGSVGRGVCRSSADPYRPFIGDILAQRPCLCAPRITASVRPRGCPGSVIEIQRLRLESGTASALPFHFLRADARVRCAVADDSRVHADDLAADAGGLQSGDVILSVNRAEVASAAEAGAALDAIEAGRTAFVLVQRRDMRVFLQTAEGSVTGVDGLAGAAG